MNGDRNRCGERWNATDLATLEASWETKDRTIIADRCCRSWEACRSRAHDMGLSPFRSPTATRYWTQAEMALAKRMQAICSKAQISEALKHELGAIRTPSAVSEFLRVNGTDYKPIPLSASCSVVSTVLPSIRALRPPKICQFIAGSSRLICGAPSRLGKPYCEEHCRICYTNVGA